MTFHEVKDICENFVATNPDVTMEQVCQIFIDNREDLGLPYADLGKLLHHLGHDEMIPVESLNELRDQGYLL